MPFYRYTLLAPMRDVYVDSEERELTSVKAPLADGAEVTLTLIGRPSSPEMIRSEIGGVEIWSDDQKWAEARFVDHLISVLRLTTDQPIERLMLGHGFSWIDTNGDAEGKPRMTMTMQSISTADYVKELKSASLLFEKTLEARKLFKLLGDAQHPSLPLAYRYLSIYKALELEFKFEHKWPQLNALLQPYEDEYRSLNVSSQSFENCIHSFRDRCAHIKIGKGDEVRGVTGLDEDDYPKVDALFGLLKRIVLQHLTTKLPIAVSHPPPDTQGVAPPEAKLHLEEIHKGGKAADLDDVALYWEREAQQKPPVIAKAAFEFARQARLLAGLLRVQANFG